MFNLWTIDYYSANLEEDLDFEVYKDTAVYIIIFSNRFNNCKMIMYLPRHYKYRKYRAQQASPCPKLKFRLH